MCSILGNVQGSLYQCGENKTWGVQCACKSLRKCNLHNLLVLLFLSSLFV